MHENAEFNDFLDYSTEGGSVLMWVICDDFSDKTVFSLK